MFKRQHHIFKRLNNLADAIITAFSFVFAYQLRNNLAAAEYFRHLGPLAKFEYYATIFVIACLLWPLLTNLNGLYSSAERRFTSDVNIIFRSSIEAMLLLIAVSYIFQLAEISRILIVGFALVNFALLTAKNLAFRIYDAYLKSRGRHIRNIVLVGDNAAASNMIDLTRKHADLGLNVIGVIGLGAMSESADQAALGTLSEIKNILHNHAIDQVIFLVDRKSLSDVEEAMFICEEEGVETWLAADFFELTLSRLEMEEIGDIPFLVFRTAPALSWQMVIKYFLDHIFAAAFLIVLSPLFVIVYAAIKMDSHGPAFLVQQRMGLRGKPFNLYKFRSMTDDGRVTRIGRFLRKSGLDELPQLINILKGEMSFVGPRPHIPSEVALYAHGWQRRRLSMRPGLTCYRQILYPGKVAFSTAMELDLKYIDNWSLAKDVAILFKTVPLILSRFGKRGLDS